MRWRLIATLVAAAGGAVAVGAPTDGLSSGPIRYCDYVAPGVVDSTRATHGKDHRVLVRSEVLKEETELQANAGAVVLLTRADALEKVEGGWRFRGKWLGVHGDEAYADSMRESAERCRNGKVENALCPDAHYRDEPFVRWKRRFPLRCTGIIVAPGLVLTAKHCIDNEPTREQIRLVRDARDLRATFAPGDVAKITNVPFVGAGDQDLALVEVAGVDAPGVPWADVPLPGVGRPPHSPSVYTIGHSFGLPSTFAGCAIAKWGVDDSKVPSNLDAHKPSGSGSPVFDAQSHQLVGVAVDFTLPFALKGGTHDGCPCKRISFRGDGSPRTMIQRLDENVRTMIEHRRTRRTSR